MISPDGRKSLQQNQGTTASGDILSSVDYIRTKADPFGPITVHIRGAGSSRMKYSKLSSLQIVPGQFLRNGSICTQLNWFGDSGEQESIWLDPAKEWRVVAQSMIMGDGRRTNSLFHYSDNSICGSLPSRWEMKTLEKGGRPGATQTVRVTKAEVNPPLDCSQFHIDFPADTVVYDDSANPSLRQVVQPSGELVPHPNTEPELLASLKRSNLLRAILGILCLGVIFFCVINVWRQRVRSIRSQRRIGR